MAGLLGVGGGGILVPLLASIFAYQGLGAGHVVHLALGTSLACMIVSSTASIRAHAKRQTVMWKVFYAMAPGIITGAFLTSRIAVHIGPVCIALFFSLFMGLVAVQMFVGWQLKASARPATLSGLFAVGVGIGSVSALAAVGGGFLAVTYLNYKNLGMKNAVGTSSAIGFPIAVAGTLGYMLAGWAETSGDAYVFGFIHVPAFLAISAASFVAAPYGAGYAHKLPDARLKKIFAVISLMLGIKIFWSVM
jgi:uncharacterized membrane protein YfcA